jgi:4,5-DOPA dioxygenase extradiol
MYPRADIPVVQLSLDYTKSAKAHYELAKELSPLRDQGILILGSGNIVHNLRRIVFRGSISDFNQPFALPWAHEANDLIHMLIQENRYEELADYQALGPAVQLAIPTPEHYLPFLYAIALKDEADIITFFNDKPVAGSLTMTCLKIS